jgi:hypothetical protein
MSSKYPDGLGMPSMGILSKLKASSYCFGSDDRCLFGLPTDCSAELEEVLYWE